MDGTLAETEEVHRAAFNQAFGEAGLGWHWSEDAYRVLLGVTGGRERMAAYMAERGLAADPALVATLHVRKNAIYAARVAGGAVEPRSGVVRLIEEAGRRGLALAIATTTSRANLTALLASLSAGRPPLRFAAMIVGEDVARKKPDPEAYARALAALALDPSECVAIEDSRNGLAAARAAGIATVVTPSRYTAHEDFAGAALIASSLENVDVTRLEALVSRAADGIRRGMTSDATVSDPSPGRRIFMLGGTGTIGRATVRALVARGHEVVCLVRPRTTASLEGAEIRFGDATDPASLARDGFRGERFDVLLSCLASRTGAPRDAWAIDHDAHALALDAAKAAGVTHMILLSAICVQKPRLAFQHAKLAFERALIASGMAYTIVRPTAFFKSLSGQVGRVTRGKPFLVFGDGGLTACKPISDDDLGSYLAGCVENPARRDRILPIGGPGPAITPREQGEHLFALLGRPPRMTHVPVALLDAIIAALSLLGRLAPALREKAELARIGRYYATESMLVLDPVTGRYDADATPSTGTETLFAYQARLVRGEAAAERGDHAVFR